MQLDLLIISAHPDDAELSCGGTILSHIAQGKTAGLVDLTMGELGTRGTPELRLREAQKAAAVLGVSVRENLQMSDGFFKNDREHQLLVIEKIRQFRPRIVITNPLSDRHPDHERAGALVKNACFLSGLQKIETTYNNQLQEPWRPEKVFHFIQHYQHKPDFIVDISGFLDKKMEAIQTFRSQFYNPDSDEPSTLLSNKAFLEGLRSRSIQYGSVIYREAGEGFLFSRSIGVNNLFDVL